MYQANATSTSQPPVVTQSVNYGYGGSDQVGYSGYTQFDHSSQGISKISHFLERIVTEYIEKKNSLQSELQIDSIHFVRIRSKN